MCVNLELIDFFCFLGNFLFFAENCFVLYRFCDVISEQLRTKRYIYAGLRNEKKTNKKPLLFSLFLLLCFVVFCFVDLPVFLSEACPPDRSLCSALPYYRLRIPASSEWMMSPPPTRKSPSQIFTVARDWTEGEGGGQVVCGFIFRPTNVSSSCRKPFP